MQTIICYVSPVSNGSVLGVFRDRLNSMGGSLPVLSAGVPCVLKLRLFSEPGSTVPFPLDSLVGVADWSFELDNDYDSATTVKLVADNADITLATVEEGDDEFTEFTIPISNTLTEELAAVLSVKPRIALVGELVGRDSNGAAQFVLQVKNFVIRNRISDPATPTPVPTKSYAEIAEAAVSGAILSSGLATSADAARIASGAAATIASGAISTLSGGLQNQINERPTPSEARQIASGVITSGGYAKSSEVREAVNGAVATASGALQGEIDERTTSSGARQIASSVVMSGGFVDGSGARLIAEEVVAGGVSVKSRVEVFDWDSTSAYIPVLSGGTCYNFLQPISALRIDAVPRSLEDATILCHFSGGTNFLYPPDLGGIGDVEVSSGFYRIAVNAKQLIAASVSYTGPVGIYSEDGPEGVTSTWVMRDWNIEKNFVDHIVYNGGAASNVRVISSVDGRGELQVSGGYVERLYVGENGFVRATGGTISGLTVSAKGTAYIYGGEVQDLVIYNSGATPQVRASNGGIVSGVRTSGVCEFWLYSGGRAEQVDCAISTFCHVSGGALVTGGVFAGTRLKIIGGRAVGLTLAMRASGDANNGVLAGGVLSDCLIAPGGIYIVRGGTAYATTIGSSGARFVVSGGTASAVTISSGGTLTVSSGGTALAVTSNAGAVVVSNAGAVVEYV